MSTYDTIPSLLDAESIQLSTAQDSYIKASPNGVSVRLLCATRKF